MAMLGALIVSVSHVEGSIQIAREGRSNGLRTFILRWNQRGSMAFFQLWGVGFAPAIAMCCALVVSVSMWKGAFILQGRAGPIVRGRLFYVGIKGNPLPFSKSGVSALPRQSQCSMVF